MRVRIATLCAVACAAACGLSACGVGMNGAGQDEAASRSPSSTVTVTVPPSEGAAGSDKGGTSAEKTVVTSAPKTSAAGAADLPEGAYPGAGGPIPEEAVYLQEIENHATEGHDAPGFMTPSRNIQCLLHDDFGNDGIRCHVGSWQSDLKYPNNYSASDRGSSYNFVLVPELSLEMMQGLEIGLDDEAIVDYGTVVYWGKNVCAVERAGVTCWDSVNGRGAFINRSGVKFFGGKGTYGRIPDSERNKTYPTVNPTTPRKTSVKAGTHPSNNITVGKGGSCEKADVIKATQLDKMSVDHCDGSWARVGVDSTDRVSELYFDGSAWRLIPADGRNTYGMDAPCYDVASLKKKGLPEAIAKKLIQCDAKDYY